MRIAVAVGMSDTVLLYCLSWRKPLGALMIGNGLPRHAIFLLGAVATACV